MLAIGRALVTNPEIILLDEPSEGLSPPMVNERVISICRELLASGISILLVEQNIHIAEALSERVYVLLGGKTVYEGKQGSFWPIRNSATNILEYSKQGGDAKCEENNCYCWYLGYKGGRIRISQRRNRKQGCETFVIDVGILGSSSWEPDIGADVVAQKGGSSLEDLAVRHDRGEALNVMCDGVAKVINEIYSERSFHGIVSMGGEVVGLP